MTQDEMAALVKQSKFEWLTPDLRALILLVAAKEREACAKVCESYLSESPYSWGGTTMSAAIRARGQA